jgi:uncharacterized protein YkwD
VKSPWQLVGAVVLRAGLTVLVALSIAAARAEPTGDTEHVSADWSAEPHLAGSLEDGLIPLAFAEPTPTPSLSSAPVAHAAPAPARSAGAAAPGPPVSVGAAGASAVELRMLALMNGSRAGGGLVPLSLDPSASSVARGHSAVEARLGYVFHDGVDGTAASRNRPACGSGWFGENTGKVWGGNVDALHRYFMSEPWIPINHRTNIMDPYFRRAGIGAVQGADAIFITVIFCR